MTDHFFPLRPLFLSLGDPAQLSSLPSQFTTSLRLSLLMFHHWTSHIFTLLLPLGGLLYSHLGLGQVFSSWLSTNVIIIPSVSVLVSSSCFNKIPWAGWFKQPTIYFSQFRRLEVWNQGCQHSWVLVRVLFLVCKWLSSCCILTWGREMILLCLFL